MLKRADHAAPASALVGYEFGGFTAPVDTLVPNLVQAWRAITGAFSLGGDRGLEIFQPDSSSSRLIGCGDLENADLIEETVTALGSGLSYNAASDTYQYIWKTNGSWAGTCRSLVLVLADGSSATAVFDFRK